MPVDFLVYWFSRPAGLAVLAAFIALSFVCWRLRLGSRYQEIGLTPLAVAYLCALAGLVVLSFWGAYANFDARVGRGLLDETKRWSLVPSWTVYRLVLSTAFVVPSLALIGVPLVAWFLKYRPLTYRDVAILMLGIWATFAVLLWLFISGVNGKIEIHVLAELLKESIAGVILIMGPFLFALHLTTRRKLPTVQ